MTENLQWELQIKEMERRASNLQDLVHIFNVKSSNTREKAQTSDQQLEEGADILSRVNPGCCLMIAGDRHQPTQATLHRIDGITDGEMIEKGINSIPFFNKNACKIRFLISRTDTS